MMLLLIFLAFTAVVFTMAIFKCRPDEDCRSCKAYYESKLREKDTQIHGLKSTKGALQKEVQNLVWSNNGYNAR